MSRLQTIESRLQQINATVFQELCDSYLILKEKNYAAITRTGSQIGKQKTTKGTPDTFYQLENGSFLYSEITTDSSTKNKLANDIEACFDAAKTKIPIEKIQEIILCFNWNIQQNEIDRLTSLARKFKSDITLRFLMLQELAIELHLNHRDLAHHYLGLPLDTGQIVSIDTFILEYDRASKGIATPLNNAFLHRDDELKKLGYAIDNNDFVILTGSPGVGKTKLAIETISNYIKTNQTFNAYCVSYKNHTLLDDLYQHMDVENDYLLFVDDANRIDAFGQITGFYKRHRKGRLKVIITVRDYAFQEIGKKCQEFSVKRIDVEKLPDDKIIDIIKSEPFIILNPDYHKEIVRISDGNPRLAIMTSLLAKKEQSLGAMHDVSDLFEKYFSTFTADNCEFENPTAIKCLGIISFFYTIPYKNREITDGILKKFGITYGDFIDTIDKLDQMELAEIRFDNVKVPEQNLALFFFYKAFIKDGLLSFNVLLNNYFESHKKRFDDCIIPANNTFGPQNVMEKIRPFLGEYWKQIESGDQNCVNFLDSFWFYLESQTLEFIYRYISSMPVTPESVFNVGYEKNQFVYNRDVIIELVGKFFMLYTPSLRDAIELLFEYARKAPEKLPELLHKIRESLIFCDNDRRYDFYKQKVLYEILIQGVNDKDSLLSAAFFELSKTFLGTDFQQFQGARNGNFVHYRYQLPNNSTILEFRTKIWNALDENFQAFPALAFDLLKNSAIVHPNSNTELIEFDIPFALSIIDRHLEPDIFRHCKYVQDHIRWLKRKGFDLTEFSSLSSRFTNETYDTFLILDWGRYKGRQRHDFKDYKEYDRLKAAQVRESFLFRNTAQVFKFYDTFFLLKNASESNWNYNHAFDLVLDQNCNADFEIGMALLCRVVERSNELGYVPRLFFYNQLKNRSNTARIWKLIVETEFYSKELWELAYFDFVDDSLIDIDLAESLLNTISTMKDSNTIFLDKLERYLDTDPQLFRKILEIVIRKNETEGAGLQLWENTFSSNMQNLGDDIDLIKKAYLQQKALQPDFDYDGGGILKIMESAPRFLVDYVASLYLERDNIDITDADMSFIWKIENIDKTLSAVFDVVVEKQIYLGVSEHYCNVFFKNPHETENRIKGDNFIRQYVIDNNSNYKKMQIIVDILRHTRTELFVEIFQQYISLNQDVKTFEKLMWKGSGGTYAGDVIVGDIRAAEWRNLLELVNKSNLGIKGIPIKHYITEEIESSLNLAEWERQRKFLSNRF